MPKNAFIVFLIALVTAMGVQLLWARHPSGPLSENHKESALDRIKRTGHLRCGHYFWPPYFDMDPNTKTLTGLHKETDDAVFRLTGWKVDYVEIVLGNEVEDLRKGRIDVMCGAGPFYLNSIKEVAYTDPLFHVSAYVYGRENETRFKTMNELNTPGVKFVGLDGDVSVDLVPRFFPKAAIQALPATTDMAQLLLSVTTHKADVTINDDISVDKFNASNADKIRRLFAEPVAIYGFGFSVLKDETSLWETLNQYTRMALNMNLIDPILKKYDPDGTLFLPVVKGYRSGR